MQLPITDARKQLPELVKRAQSGEVIEITVRGEVVARLLAPEVDARPVADRLVNAIETLERRRVSKRRMDVSLHKSEHLTRRAR